jgi:hypothetical protein
MSHAFLPVPTSDNDIYTFEGITGNIELPLLTIVIGVTNNCELLVTPRHPMELKKSKNKTNFNLNLLVSPA